VSVASIDGQGAGTQSASSGPRDLSAWVAERVVSWSRGAALARIALVASTLLLACSRGGTSVASRAAESPYDVLDQTARVLVLVEESYVEPVDRTRLMDGALRGMVSALDPHSAYLPPREYGIFQSDTSGRFGGVGVEVDFRGEYVLVISPIEGSPAHRAGILPGDRILSIDSVSVSDRSPEELVALMRGRPGSAVTLTIRRDKEDRPRRFTLTREVIQVSSVLGKRLAGDVGYLRIKQFQSGTHTELLRAVAEIRKQGAVLGFLIDLRNNPGGLVNEASAVADELLDGGVIYSTRHRGSIVDEVSATRFGSLERGPIVVLVNEYSASAAELVAGALQDHKRATVVGARTFGKGSVQTIVDLPNGAGLKLTTMRYYTPRGRSIQAQGIEPTVRIDMPGRAARSPAAPRESDLENHLPAEGSPEAPRDERGGPTLTPAVVPPPADGPVPPLDLGVARQIPEDPRTSPDVALRVGYEILLGVLLD
jgi:carboxyl-terminal processing protease